MNKEDNIFDSLSLDKLLDQRNKIPLKKYMFGNFYFDFNKPKK